MKNQNTTDSKLDQLVKKIKAKEFEVDDILKLAGSIQCTPRGRIFLADDDDVFSVVIKIRKKKTTNKRKLQLSEGLL